MHQNCIRFENICLIRLRISLFGLNYSNTIRIPNYLLTSDLSMVCTVRTNVGLLDFRYISTAQELSECAKNFRNSNAVSLTGFLALCCPFTTVTTTIVTSSTTTAVNNTTTTQTTFITLILTSTRSSGSSEVTIERRHGPTKNSSLAVNLHPLATATKYQVDNLISIFHVFHSLYDWSSPPSV